MGISSPASQPGSIFPSENFQPSAVQYNSQPSARVQHNQLLPALSDPPPDSIEDESDNLSENDGDPTIEKCTPEEYLLTKGRIIGCYRLMWRPFRPIIEDGLIRSSKDANPRSFSSRRQRLHIDYVALTKIAPLIPDLARESGPHGISSTAAMTGLIIPHDPKKLQVLHSTRPSSLLRLPLAAASATADA
ncbi:hypothetical protein BD779DRAFT_1677464 [Infundibulicybe gibba]|nr:hypothetical protein BD779DRAFT_1679600 [Infundibulicybe gibba]KAF8877210.1 hypothetical protein BD779DRAFT_1677464 [Infundibulicybe gibba]